MIQPRSARARYQAEITRKPVWSLPCFPKKPRHLKNKGPGHAKSYFDRPGSGLLTEAMILARRNGNPKGAY